MIIKKIRRSLTTLLILGLALIWSLHFIYAADPLAENMVINSSLGTNLSTENITAYWDVSDGDGDNVTNMTNWFRGGSSITYVNLPFEGGSNSVTTTDYSERETNIKVGGAVWGNYSGYNGWGAYEFNKDYINMTLDAMDALSIVFWFNYTAADTIYSTIFGRQSTSLWVLINGGKIKFSDTGGGGNSTHCSHHADAPGIDVGDTNVWQHIAITRPVDGSNITLYKNGAEVATCVPHSTGTYAPSTVYQLGTDSVTGNEYINGTIDEFVIYNRALDSAQVKAIYENRTDTIVSEELEVGDNWSACVTPNDGALDGLKICSVNLTILAAAEEAASVAVPEFSDFAAILILIVAVSGFFVVQNAKKE